MRKTRIYRILVVFFLLAVLFGSSAAISITATEIMFAIALAMVVVIVIVMSFRPQFKNKK